MIGSMHKTFAAGCAALTMTLAGCSAGNDAKPTEAKTTAIKPDGMYTDIDQLRAAIQEAGIKCPDSIWKPEPTSEIGVGEGWCGDSLRIVVTPEDDLKRADAESKLSREIMQQDFDHIGEHDYSSPRLVTGSRWAAIAKPSAAKTLVSKLYGSDTTEESAKS